MAESLRATRDQQRLIIAGFLKNSYVLTISMNDIRDSYFTDSSCRIIYKSLRDFYENYGEMPSEDELMVSVEANYVEFGDSLETVKDTLHQLYNKAPVSEKFLVNQVTDFVGPASTIRRS